MNEYTSMCSNYNRILCSFVTKDCKFCEWIVVFMLKDLGKLVFIVCIIELFEWL